MNDTATTYAVTDPASGEVLATFPTITDDELRQAIATADDTHAAWGRSSTVAERAALLHRVAELYRERREALATTIVREMAKPIDQAYGEVDFCADIYDYYADHAEEFLADQPITLAEGSEGSAFVRKSSVGVLLGIMPWNFPAYQIARFAGPNLVIGNTVLLKHAPQCPESALAIEAVFHDAGFPAGAYTNVFATNDQVADVIADPRVQGVSLTGSARAGAAVAEIAGRNLTKVVLELGGSDPFILLSTDDLDAVVESAVATRLEGNGQVCNAAKRFLVADHLYDDFLAKFTAAMSTVEPTDPSVSGAELGPLSSPTAADRLEEQLRHAVDQGASVVTGGERRGNAFTPTVLTDVTPDNDAYREEFFGPVAAVHRVADEDAAIAIANDTPFGLGSYLFTTDPEQALRVADRIEAGMVYVNIVGADSPELPFGGVKASGFGRELGPFGADEFVNKKLIRIG
ncbi:succinate-semialdehyde dehydrogenase/glutarate-semialdehyde dehydrogenase [Curtobacterium luteum]|uniref:Succinate-semialdehyde dehydrogenase n=1 Tax=Curtobacterium luteum TaxID=33881 RepID=A0A8H9GB02_9MICO|nr:MULTISPECIES: NAD-dependent succinate-semialdehyde dehydrogenase [Curtobacterium]MBM7803403.1 succinate-semialdehyde dehydrogenase/glutarate-semialdehyde dehydrogenase [Curtobacterium luteum]NUU49568.1 NAD-dependent succinate-semialdehyde dehydrogenase [Curtobacterium luteum]GGL11324.1 succinate-semialdehyde dehydrogenase [Curtobacterium luteum]